MVNPQELKQGAFSKTFKGYAVAEVDDYILYLTDLYSELYAEYSALEVKYQATLDALEEATHEDIMASNIVKRAQASADEIAANARVSAEETVSAAQARADEIKNSVSESCNKILDLYLEKVAAERDKLAACEKAVAQFKDDLFDAYKKHISIIDNIMPDVDPTPFLTDEELEKNAMDLASKKLASSGEKH